MGKPLGYDFDAVHVKKGIYLPEGHMNIENEHALIRRGAIDLLFGHSSLKMDVQSMPVDEKSIQKQKDLIEMFREYSQVSDGAFPDSLDLLTTPTIVAKNALVKMQIQGIWAALAPESGKPNEEQRRKLEELILKTMDAKLTEDQRRKIAEEMQEYTL